MNKYATLVSSLLIIFLVTIMLLSCTDDLPDNVSRTPTPINSPVQTEFPSVEISKPLTPTTILKLTSSPTIIVIPIENTPTPVSTSSVEEFSELTTVPLGWIAYSEWYGKSGIDVIYTDRKSLLRIVDWEGFYNSPRWSPDGQWIVFSFREINSSQTDLYLARPDGSLIKRLTFSNGDKILPSWSPDGNRIVFSRYLEQQKYDEIDIFTIESDGSQLTRLTNTPDTWEYNPVYSPDGEYISFLAKSKDMEFDQYELMIMNEDGTDVKHVIKQPVGDSSISWSPDSKRLAFRSSEGCGNLFVVNIDGSGLRQITNTPGRDRDPTWSEDGNHIAFNSTEKCNDLSEGVALGWQIYIVNIDNVNDMWQLTDNNKSYPLEPAWAPVPPLEKDKNFIITESGNALRLRSIPSLNGIVLAELKIGDEILIIEGPVVMDNYLWWKVSVNNGEIEGWVAENPGWFSLKE